MSEDDFLDVLAEEGKEITINIRIEDREKAKILLGTMYDLNIDQLGVQVTSWGFWNIQEAQRLRVQAIQEENERHHKAIKELIKRSDKDFLKEDK